MKAETGRKAKKNTKNRRKEEKRRSTGKHFGKKQYFPPAEERISTDKISEICKEEQIYMKESTVKKSNK